MVFIRIFIFFLLWGFTQNTVWAVVISSNVYEEELSCSENVVVAPKIDVCPKKLYVKRTINFENNGNLETDIYVADRCDLYIKNRGNVDSVFFLGENANLYQVISGKEDVTKINFNKSYAAIINSESMLDFSDLLLAVGDADKFVMNDAFINLDDFYVLSNVELNGSIKLKVNDINSLYDKVLFNNVSGNGDIRIISDNTDILFANVAYVFDDSLYLKRIRETDYVKILNNDKGVFLNKLRAENPNDGLLKTLDRASSMDEINKIMDKSARLNSDVLMRPIQIINAFDVLRQADVHSGIYIVPTMIFSNDFLANYVVAGVGIAKRGEYDFAINLRSGAIEYDASIDTFGAEFFGGNVDLHYWAGDVFMRVVGGMDFSKYDIGNVFYENNRLYNPDAQSMYAEIDFGYDFNVTDSVYVMPIVGAMGWGYSIDKMSQFSTSAHVGVGAGYTFDVLGIEYDYSVRARVGSDNYYTAMLQASFWSEFDAVGGVVDVSLVRMFDVTSYKLSIGGRVWF